MVPHKYQSNGVKSNALRWPNNISSAADKAIFKNRAQNIECSYGCVARSAVLLKPNAVKCLLFNFCDPLRIAIDCNGLSLLIFEEKWSDYAFSETFLEIIFATQIKAMLLKQSAVLFISCPKEVTVVQQVVCWLIRRKLRVRNTKSISSAISSQQISGKNSESK